MTAPDIDPHVDEENPLDFEGDETPDPWEDEAQSDWPNETVGEEDE